MQALNSKFQNFFKGEIFRQLYLQTNTNIFGKICQALFELNLFFKPLALLSRLFSKLLINTVFYNENKS